MTFCDFSFDFSDVLHKEYYIAYRCPDFVVNFDVVDFSERRSEEVMFLLTLSVCSLLQIERNVLNWRTKYMKT